MTKRISRYGRTMNSVSKQRFIEDVPSKKTLLMIQMANDLGYDAYWAGDKAVFGSLLGDSTYELIENLVELGWERKLDNV